MLDRIRGRFDILLAFATVIISLSAFKEELSKFSVDLGFLRASVAQCLLTIVGGLTISLYLYVVEAVFHGGRFANSLVLKSCLYGAYFLFAISALSPVLIALDAALVWLTCVLAEHTSARPNQLIAPIVSVVFGLWFVGWMIWHSRAFTRWSRLHDLQFMVRLNIDSARPRFTKGNPNSALRDTIQAVDSCLEWKLMKVGVQSGWTSLASKVESATLRKLIDEKEQVVLKRLLHLNDKLPDGQFDPPMEEVKEMLGFAENFARECLATSERMP